MKTKLKLKNKFIPVNTPKIFKEDKINVNKCLNTGWVSSEGSFVNKFENSFAEYNKRKYGVAVSSGTAALEIALKSLNLQKNSEVIIPTFTIISSALSVIKLGLKPVLVDCDLIEWNTPVNEIKKKITKKTKAIIATHIYGFAMEIDQLVKVCKRKKIYLIEDSAEMIGQTHKNKKCGSFGDLSTFSFYANKHITTGEGGMILTNDKKLFEKSKSLRNLCFGSTINRFNHDDIGWNYRMTNLQAAMGCGQLKNIKWIINRKKEIGKIYYEKLKNNPNIYIQPTKIRQKANIYWVVGILILKRKFKKDNIMNLLNKYGIGTRSFFYPMHNQKIFKKMKIFNSRNKFKNSEFLFNNGFYLPSGLGIKNTEINYICRIINKIFK